MEKICCIIFSRHRDAHLIILVNDRYDLPFTIKDDEHQRRAAKHHHIRNVFPKPDDIFPATAELNKVIVNSSNKVRLQKLLLEHMKLQIEKIGITVIYCHSELSTNLTTGVTNDEFGLKHPEADTMLLSIYAKLRINNISNIAILDSEDKEKSIDLVKSQRKVQ